MDGYADEQVLPCEQHPHSQRILPNCLRRPTNTITTHLVNLVNLANQVNLVNLANQVNLVNLANLGAEGNWHIPDKDIQQ